RQFLNALLADVLILGGRNSKIFPAPLGTRASLAPTIPARWFGRWKYQNLSRHIGDEGKPRTYIANAISLGLLVGDLLLFVDRAGYVLD
ncbi:MAG: hypothetical protein LBQ66_15375, partial [Planctomycetaceae bacterium]|nr:hypothetical protein [Planctomycetaceae bacterium]